MFYSQWSDVLVLNTKAVCPDATGKPRVKGKPKQESVAITWGTKNYSLVPLML